MKLVMTLVVRNEAEILAANLDYHLAQGVDAVIVTDHGSSDETPDILHRYERDGVATVIRDDREGHHQSIRVTHMAQIALTEHRADWLIHNDADEFWWPLAGSLHDVFAAIPAQYGQIVVQRRNFLPRPDGPGSFEQRLIHREASSLNLSGTPLEPKVAHRARPGVVVAPGNHAISGADLAPLPSSALLEVLHFPMRSFAQFEAKVLQTGVGYEQLPDRSPGIGRDQLALLAIQREGALANHYYSRIADDHALADGIANGAIIVDRRLADFTKRPPGPKPPDDPAARAHLAAHLNALLALEEARGEAQRAREAWSRTNDHANELTERLHALAAQNEALSCELEAARESLHALRTSRLVRWSKPARRIYHGIRG